MVLDYLERAKTNWFSQDFKSNFIYTDSYFNGMPIGIPKDIKINTIRIDKGNVIQQHINRQLERFFNGERISIGSV